MSDLIFKTDGKETHRISFPNLGTKCPETKLEIKMTEKFTLELTLDELHMLDKYVEYCEETKEFFDKLKNAYPKPKSPAEEAYKRCYGEYPSGSTSSENAKWDAFLRGYQSTQPKAVPVDEPDYYDEVEWDEKDNPSYRITDEVVNKMLKKWEENPPDFLKFEMGKTLEELITRWWLDIHTVHKDWDVPTYVDDLIDQIQLWLPKEQDSSGTQDVSVIDLVDGYNDCLEKIKSKLRNKR